MKTLSRVAQGGKTDVLRLQDELLTKVNPALRKEVLDGVLTEQLTLTGDWQLVEHKLGRNPLGWVLVAPQWAQPTWTAPTLINSWADVGGTDLPAGYMVEPGGWVALRGRVNTGTVGFSFFLLPANLRPTYHHHIVCVCEDGAANRAPYHLNVAPSGYVTPYQVGAAFHNNYVVIEGRFQVDASAVWEVEETTDDNPDRTRYIRLRSPFVGSTTQLWVF